MFFWTYHVYPVQYFYNEILKNIIAMRKINDTRFKIDT